MLARGPRYGQSPRRRNRPGASRPCADAKPDHGLLCGRLSVPEDRSKPGGAAYRAERHGRPGIGDATPTGSDIPLSQAAPATKRHRSAPIWAGLPFERNRDLVFVDQRGTRGSGSLYCEDLDDPADIMMPRFHLPAVELCRDRLARQADLTKYSTLEAVEDFDAVRQWLGYDRINVIGGSYGSRVVLEYLRRHGDRTRTAVVAKPVPPGFQAAAVLRPRRARGAARHLRRLQDRRGVPAGIPRSAADSSMPCCDASSVNRPPCRGNTQRLGL